MRSLMVSVDLGQWHERRGRHPTKVPSMDSSQYVYLPDAHGATSAGCSSYGLLLLPLEGGGATARPRLVA